MYIVPDTTCDRFDVLTAGNQRFRSLCELRKERYSAAKSKIEKSLIVMEIVDAIREGSQCGGFVKKDPKASRWYEVGDAVAREKVGQQLRDCLKSDYCRDRVSPAITQIRRNKEALTNTPMSSSMSIISSASKPTICTHEKQLSSCSETDAGLSDAGEMQEQAEVQIFPAPPPLIAVPSEQLAHLLITSLAHEQVIADDGDDDDFLVPPMLTSVPSDQLANVDEFLRGL